jgi:hypothetical protein
VCSLNRRMRTRMYGGVGGGERKLTSYPIRAHAVDFGTPGDSRLPAYSVEKLISCALTILRTNHSVAENQA